MRTLKLLGDFGGIYVSTALGWSFQGFFSSIHGGRELGGGDVGIGDWRDEGEFAPWGLWMQIELLCQVCDELEVSEVPRRSFGVGSSNSL